MAIHADLEYNIGVSFGPTPSSRWDVLRSLLAFANHHGLGVPIGAEVCFVMLDDDELAVPEQAVTRINDAARAGCVDLPSCDPR